jgi:hypothetical protein
MKNKKILMQLLKMKTQLHDEFNFSYINGHHGDIKKTINNIHNCGSSGCLLGNLPQFDTDWKFKQSAFQNLQYKDFQSTGDSIINYFDIPQHIIKYMFYPNHHVKILNNEIHALTVSDILTKALIDSVNICVSPGSDATLKEVQKHIKNIIIEFPQYFKNEK